MLDGLFKTTSQRDREEREREDKAISQRDREEREREERMDASNKTLRTRNGDDGLVTVKDVQQATPAETLEESDVYRGLDRRDPTGGSVRHFDRMISLSLLDPTGGGEASNRHILGGDRFVPVGLRDSTFGGSSSSTDLPETVEDELYLLTRDINNLDYELQVEGVEEPKEHCGSGGDDIEQGAAGTPSTATTAGTAGFPTKKPAPPPADVFHKRNGSHIPTQGDVYAAHVGKIYNRFEKNQKERHGPGLQRTNDHLDSSTKTDQKRFKKHFRLGKLKEFGRHVGSSKRHAWTYIRTAVLVIILPATAVACMLFYAFDNPLVKPEQKSLFFQDLLLDTTKADSTEAPVNNTESESPSNNTINNAGSNYPTPAPTVETTAAFVFGLEQNIALATNSTVDVGPSYPSYSWWVLFLFVRQVITFILAKGVERLVNKLALNVPLCTLYSPTARVFILQAKGWPMHLLWWAIIDFIILYGGGEFANHWLYWQNSMGVFNAENPAGSVTSNPKYHGVLQYAICFAVAVAVKRFITGIRFASASYMRYAEKLSDILKKVLLVSKVAQLADTTSDEDLEDLLDCLEPEDTADTDDGKSDDGNKVDEDHPLKDVVEEEKKDELVAPPRPDSLRNRTYTIELTDSQKVSIQALLEEWEELEILDKPIEEVSMASIVQFRASISVLDSVYPFSLAFGQARTRAQVTVGSQLLFEKLHSLAQNTELEVRGNKNKLKFSTIALAALKKRETRFSTFKKDLPSYKMDRATVKSLIKMFRPHRNGTLSLLDFCKSIDHLYKELRMLRANIANEARINAASENLLNIFFYVTMFMIFLAVVGIDPLALFGFLTTFIVGFAFMIGGASSDYFRGLLFILVQRPYDIGDRIAVGNTESIAPATGSASWIVKDVTLYHTTVIYGATQEYATFANGKLSTSRIINCARSPRATLNFLISFGIAVSAAQIDEFKSCMIEYVKSKPREWFAFTAFRMTRIETDRAFVEYRIILQHRYSWQQVGALLDSLGNAQQHAFNLSKSLGMNYENPSMPVTLRMGRPEIPTDLSQGQTNNGLDIPQMMKWTEY